MQLLDRLVTYDRSGEVADIQQGLQAAVDDLWTAADGVMDGVYVATASASLRLWEKLYAVDIDASLPHAQRREIIKAKMRSSGATTVDLIKNVAESYVNGEVAVTEQHADYTFTITFVSTKGRPTLLDELKKSIEQIKPAHLGVLYIFTYVTHGEIKAAGYTHGQLATYTHAEMRATLEV